ncbi:uncharacterized protein MONOS_3858 [Monocercomonoides exilis]|uniref:uncharacterized protein n=1 Tax=Monocercomonoides exilis TaxID=2049356 RepID=UPI00355AAE60|nr:hypothetical protein MONOS_3858 [Monocercomonoides exilis]|eukprot:MONOS_3858.1-p1 / transcript=MONOS_3858.1 / gene=MONOS_3858 / organism=Monocercomonoides_exilis_PA203 / gene_product=unspecified product / transcript_product=unspecified product / location=Mono_scaffold00095:31107-32032(+) / protein_length=214 / sequence_SO=supercontig / SO=protein_coding / is_pseudo=false
MSATSRGSLRSIPVEPLLRSSLRSSGQWTSRSSLRSSTQYFHEGSQTTRTMRDSDKKDLTVFLETKISSGIWKIEGRFKNTWVTRMFGIRSSNAISEQKHMWNCDECIAYDGAFGKIWHCHRSTSKLPTFSDGDVVGIELNMDRKQRTLHFFVNDSQVRVAVVGIPPSVQFGISFTAHASSFDVLSFTRLRDETTKCLDDEVVIKWNATSSSG